MGGTGRRRTAGSVLVVFVLAMTTLFGGVLPAAAAPAPGDPAKAPNPCTTEQWRDPGRWEQCVKDLDPLTSDKAGCVKAPTPSTPDSGMAGWFATMPSQDLRESGRTDRYTKYGYAGYDYTTYDLEGGCASTALHPDFKFEHTVANGEFLLATSVIGASNAVREKAWVPDSMWGWADPLVETATRAVYEKVFTVFGGVTLAVVGLYLLWRSRQSDMSATMTTVGWAILIMVAVTAVAKWPTSSANAADNTLMASLGVIHQALGPQDKTISADQCRNPNASACEDNRSPALRASDTVTEGLVYRNWLRGLLGSADSETAKRYGPILYNAKSFSWNEAVEVRNNPELRQKIIDQKAEQWNKVAQQIEKEDPEAYEYLQGERGMDRIGSGFIAILAAVCFALFDLTASLLVLLGFLIFRWAVIALPVLGTVGLLRPASTGIRRLANAVVAAVFNILIFGTGAAIYLFAVSLIIETDTLPGWLQVVLILLTGVVGWTLLRPYRRITQLGGKGSTGALSSIGGWHRLFFREARKAQEEERESAAGGSKQTPVTVQSEIRPEARGEDTAVGQPTARPEDRSARDQSPVSAPAQVRRWVGSDDDEPTSYAIYRPSSREAAPVNRPESEPARQ
ncbi:DMT family transporter [Virgisporangium ochraceum]|nr:DMT family transporter [Virgisporangium ochraceum]